MTVNQSCRCTWLWIPLIGIILMDQKISEAFSARLMRNARGRATAAASSSELRMFPASFLQSSVEELREAATSAAKDLSSLSSPLTSPPPPLLGSSSPLVDFLNPAAEAATPPSAIVGNMMDKLNSIASSSSPPSLPAMDFSKQVTSPLGITDFMEKLNSMVPPSFDGALDKLLLEIQGSMESLPWYFKALGALVLTATIASHVIYQIIIPTIAETLEKKAQELAPERWMSYYEEKLQEEGDKLSALTRSRLALRPELMKELQTELKPLIEADLAESALGAAGKVLGYRNS